jgi:hypothetical protein
MADLQIQSGSFSIFPNYHSLLLLKNGIEHGVGHRAPSGKDGAMDESEKNPKRY